MSVTYPSLSDSNLPGFDGPDCADVLLGPGAE